MSKERILEISHKEHLSHVGSCLTAYPIIEEIHEIMRPEDVFVLDEGHAALAYYVFLERRGRTNAEELLRKHGIHQNRDPEAGILVSAGSLGLAGSIALGMALANKERSVYCLTSDGALSEGIWWEIFRIKADKGVANLKVFVNANSWGAYDPIDVERLEGRVKQFCPDVEFRRTNVEQYSFLIGQDAHYKVMSEGDYNRTIK